MHSDKPVPAILVNSAARKLGSAAGNSESATMIASSASLDGSLDDRPKTPSAADDGSPPSNRPVNGDHGKSAHVVEGSQVLASPPRRKGQVQPETAVDPLTMQILRRTGTQLTISQRPEVDVNKGDGEVDRLSDLQVERQRVKTKEKTGSIGGQDKKKGVSFLTRLMGRKKNPPQEDEGDKRIEGMDAAVFSQPIGYIPQFPAPPRYIRVRSHHKAQQDFNNIFLAQELYKEPVYEEPGSPPTINSSQTSEASLPLPGHKSGSIWALRFSKDGKYLAAGGEDMKVRVWAVISSADERSAHEAEENAAGMDTESIFTEGRGVRLNAPVFKSEPIREYSGHMHDILDLSWSKNNFLLSSSMDKTVRLWHVTREECLCCFQHSDFVTSLAFHPRDDRFFLAGSLDSKLRLWSIPDKSVAYWAELQDLITAVAFTPDGRIAIAGSHTGICTFYETEGLKYNTQIQLKSSLGRNPKGAKITGIETVTFPPDDPNGDVKVLISSNDSRIRMYNLRDKSLETKFKGNVNTQCQIRATFSDDARFIISGSEDRRVYIWNVAPDNMDKKDKRPVEHFEAHSAIITCAVLAPTKTRQLLGSSGDPIYDLCNPPPITLVSRSDSTASSKRRLESSSSVSSSQVMKAANKVETTPSATSPNPTKKEKVTARSLHRSGNIIVTADAAGRIKVFRQDCAHSIRKNEVWEVSSIYSSRKASGSVFSGISRKRSTSERSNTPSWRNSLASDISLNGSLRPGRAASILQQEEEDIIYDGSISPRKGIDALGLNSNERSNGNPTTARLEPHSIVNNENLAGLDDNSLPHLPAPGTTGARDVLVTSSIPSIRDGGSNAKLKKVTHEQQTVEQHTLSRKFGFNSAPISNYPQDNTFRPKQEEQHGNSATEKKAYTFPLKHNIHNHLHPHHSATRMTTGEDDIIYPRPVSQRTQRTISSWNRMGRKGHGDDEFYGSEEGEVGEDNEDEDEDEGQESDEQSMICARCEGKQFRAKKKKNGQQRLICVKCKLVVGDL